MKDFKLVDSGGNQDVDLLTEPSSVIGFVDFATSDDLWNNIWMSINIKKGSWFIDPEFGSQLHELLREKNTLETRIRAEQYCKDALQWLLDTGRAQSISVESQWNSNNKYKLSLAIQVTQQNGQDLEFAHFVPII